MGSQISTTASACDWAGRSGLAAVVLVRRKHSAKPWGRSGLPLAPSGPRLPKLKPSQLQPHYPIVSCTDPTTTTSHARITRPALNHFTARQSSYSRTSSPVPSEPPSRRARADQQAPFGGGRRLRRRCCGGIPARGLRGDHPTGLDEGEAGLAWVFLIGGIDEVLWHEQFPGRPAASDQHFCSWPGPLCY
jgi:hypothetical protein